jgi:lipoate-protein ligase A
MTLTEKLGTQSTNFMQYTKSVWRLIPLLQTSGELQMAIDRWLLEQHQAGKQPSILRFYTWASPTISLGYHQRRWPEFWQQLTWKEKPLDLVRRPTGGRAVLHQGDLTYMVVTSGLTGKRWEVYEAICEFLIQGWRSLGIALHYGAVGRDYFHNPSCFGTATGADLLTQEGYKLIGSAQLRRGNVILQHGSMRLSRDTALFTQVFGEPPPPTSDLLLQQKGEAFIPIVVEALTVAACRCFNIDLIVQPLSESEWQEIRSLPPLEI